MVLVLGIIVWREDIQASLDIYSNLVKLSSARKISAVVMDALMGLQWIFT